MKLLTTEEIEQAAEARGASCQTCMFREAAADDSAVCVHGRPPLLCSSWQGVEDANGVLVVTDLRSLLTRRPG